jgi:Phosphoenolpyruvate carboxylase
VLLPYHFLALGCIAGDLLLVCDLMTGGRACARQDRMCKRFFIRCRAFDETKRELLAVEGHKALLSDPHTSMLQAKLKLRTPYITPLNILQVPHLSVAAMISLQCEGYFMPRKRSLCHCPSCAPKLRTLRASQAGFG